MMQNEQSEIRELSLEEISGIGGGGAVTDAIVNVAKEIANAVNPTESLNPPSIPQIGKAIGSVIRGIGSIF